MPHKPPLSLCNEDIALLQDVLLYYSKNGGYENNRRAAKTLFDKIADDVPRFPCYVLAWPGVTSEELAPVLSDDSAEFKPAGERNPGGMLQIGYTAEGEVLINLPRDMTGHIAFTPMQAEVFGGIMRKQARFARLAQNGQECPECANPVEHLRGRVCTSPGCPLVEAGVCRGRNGLNTPAPETVAKYAEPGPVRACPVCRGSGQTEYPLGMETCRECRGLRQVFVVPSEQTVSLLSDALTLWKAGQPDKAIPALVLIVSRLDERLAALTSDHNRTANEASMRANGIIPD